MVYIILLLAGVVLTLALLLHSIQYDHKEQKVSVLMCQEMDNDSSHFSLLKIISFENQLSGLLKMGYEVITLNMLTNFVYKGIPLPRKSALIMFDNCCVSTFRLMVPVLLKYDVKAAFFVPAGLHENYSVRCCGSMNIEQLSVLIACGHEIALQLPAQFDESSIQTLKDHLEYRIKFFEKNNIPFQKAIAWSGRKQAVDRPHPELLSVYRKFDIKLVFH